VGSTAWMEYWQEDSEKFGGQFMAINVAYHDCDTNYSIISITYTLLRIAA